MKKCVAVRTIIYFVIAALLLAVPMCVWFVKENKAEKTQVDILFLGDSLIGQYRDETSVPYLVGQALGKTTINGAFGGSTMTWYPDENSDYYQRYGLNFPALVQAICTDDFGVQKSLHMNDIGTEDFQDVIMYMESIAYDELEILVLEYGTNDYFSGTLIDGDENIECFAGSFARGIEALQEHFPNLRIVVVSPTFNWHYAAHMNCEQVEFGGGYLSDYNNALIELCDKYALEYISLYELYNHEFDIFECRLYTEDGVHPNEYGRQLIANEIVKYLAQ